MFGKLLALFKGSVICKLKHIIELLVLLFKFVINMFGMHASFDSMSNIITCMNQPTELKCAICMILEIGMDVLWIKTRFRHNHQLQLASYLNIGTSAYAESWDKISFL